MIIKVESYKIFFEIYCPIMPAPLELFFGDGCRSESSPLVREQNIISVIHVPSCFNFNPKHMLWVLLLFPWVRPVLWEVVFCGYVVPGAPECSTGRFVFFLLLFL